MSNLLWSRKNEQCQISETDLSTDFGFGQFFAGPGVRLGPRCSLFAPTFRLNVFPRESSHESRRDRIIKEIPKNG